MTKVLVKGHWYETVDAPAAGATYSRSQVDGTITFDNGAVHFANNDVDRLLCTDAIIAFDYYGNLGEMYRLYQAAFNRVPDQAGLSNNVELMDIGLTVYQMADAFLVSAEGQATYPPGPNNDAFNTIYLTLLYQHVLHRDPSFAELQAWLVYFHAPYNYTRGQVLVGFSDSAENHSNVDSLMLGGIVLTKSYFGV